MATARPGEVFGFIGANGADKTTTIRLLMDLIRPDRGSATVVRLTAGAPIEGEDADAIEAWPHDRGSILPLSWRCSLDDDWRPMPAATRQTS